MSGRHRFLLVHLLAVLLPCGVIGLLGYKWLQLERDAGARRSKEAAEAEAVRLRKALADQLSLLAEQLARKWTAAATSQPSFALPPEAPPIVTSAYLFSSEGRLLYPNYEAIYRRTVGDYRAASLRPEWQQRMARAESLEARGQRAEARRVFQEALTSAQKPGLQAWALLGLGRLALAEKQYALSESNAWRIFQCCPGARDEYEASFVLYAAAQVATAWKAQGRLRAQFPQLASRIAGLLQAGAIGHPQDVAEISSLVKRFGEGPGAAALLQQARQAANQMARHMESGRRLEKWMAGSSGLNRNPSPFSFSTFWMGTQPQVAGLYRTEGGNFLAVLFDTDRLTARVAELAAQHGHFEATLVPSGGRTEQATLQASFLPEAPAFDLVLRARETDPATQQRRQRLFAGAIAAAVLLVLLAGYFALRDFSRELELAGLRAYFIAGVTHELKTPLTSIRLLAETLRQGRTRDAAVSQELLSTLVEEAERLSRLLDNVLSFSQIDKGARVYRPAEILLTEAVQGAVQRFQYVLEQGGFRLLQNTDGQRLKVHADADGLTQALLNLLSNAVKYSGSSREIRLGVRACGHEAEISITDMGMGIPRLQQGRIFESFYRAPEAAKDTTGTGLGLALVRHFAEAHGGRVTVASEPGKGSTFTLRLPLVKESSKPYGQDSDC